MFIPSIIVITGFILVHIFTKYLRFLDEHPRNVLMSLLSGGSISYVFLHLVPELAHYQEVVKKETLPGFLENLDYVAYMISLIGIVLFYGIDKLNVRTQKQNEEDNNLTRPKVHSFAAEISAFALYNGLIGYLLPHLSGGSIAAYAVYFIVFSFHFVANNRVLNLTHEDLYTKVGRWILSFSVFVGWLLSEITTSNEFVIAILSSFLTGGLIMNVMNDELPEQKRSSLLSFIAGILIIGTLLQLIL